MKITPRHTGTASAVFLIWPIIEVIASKCGSPYCLSKGGNYSLIAFAVLLAFSVLWSFWIMLTNKK